MISPRFYLFLVGLVVAAGLGGWAGWRLHTPASSPSSNTTVATNKKDSDITIIRAPDGTVTEHRKESETSSTTKSIPIPLASWSLGVGVRSPVSKLYEYHYDFNVYHRFYSSPLFIGVGYGTDRAISLGLRMEF